MAEDLTRTVSLAVAGRIVTTLGKANVGRVLLYGSRARGDACRQSDWDILVVLEEPNLPRKRRGQLRRKCKQGLGRLRAWVDVRVVGSSEFERGQGARGSLVEAVSRSGTLLYPNPDVDEDFFEDAAAIRSSYREALSFLDR